MLSRKSGEIAEALKRFCIDICCLQEVKGREKGVEIISNGYRLLWSGASKPENEVGPIVANWLVENIVEVGSPSDRIMKVKVAIGDELWEVVSCYSHRLGGQVLKRMSFMNFWTKLCSTGFYWW